MAKGEGRCGDGSRTISNERWSVGKGFWVMEEGKFGKGQWAVVGGLKRMGGG